MPRAKTYFEQVPIEIVKKTAVPEIQPKAADQVLVARKRKTKTKR
jgi:hypothetical protein